MPVYPSPRPGYFYALHRRHFDGWQHEHHGPRAGASGVLTKTVPPLLRRGVRPAAPLRSSVPA
jgi:hypothetical protein